MTTKKLTSDLNNKVTLNIGLNVGEKVNALQVYTVKQFIVKHFSNHKTMTGCNITAATVMDNDQGKEFTAVIKVRTSLNEDQAIAAVKLLAVDLGQEAIAFTHNDQGNLVYADDTGPKNYGDTFNAEYFFA
jgi:hypothetical protein